MTADLSAIIARLEAAEVGDQDLSLEVNLALEGGEPVGRTANYVMEPYWAIRRPNPAYVGGFENGPNYPVSTSLDAALALVERVLSGWRWSVQQLGPNYEASLTIPNGTFLLSSDTEVYAISKNPALALCTAILKAKQGEGE